MEASKRTEELLRSRVTELETASEVAAQALTIKDKELAQLQYENKGLNSMGKAAAQELTTNDQELEQLRTMNQELNSEVLTKKRRNEKLIGENKRKLPYYALLFSIRTSSLLLTRLLF